MNPKITKLRTSHCFARLCFTMLKQAASLRKSFGSIPFV